MWQWLQSHSAELTLLTTVILTLITGAYALLTYRLVQANARLVAIQSTPTVAVTAYLHERHINVINLAIENQGAGPALKVALKANWGFSGRRELAEVGPFKTGLGYLAPRQRFEFFLENAIGNFDELKAHPLEIVASYFDRAGERYEETFRIDFNEFDNVHRIGEPPVYTISESLKKLEEHLAAVLRGTKLRVVSYNLEDEAAERGANRIWYDLAELSPEDRQRVAEFASELSASRKAGGTSCGEDG